MYKVWLFMDKHKYYPYVWNAPVFIFY